MNQNTASCVPTAKGSGGKQHAGGQGWLAVAATTLATAIFAADLWLPPGINGGTAYVAPILLGHWSTIRRFAILCGALATLLTIAALVLSPSAATTGAALVNSGLALFAIWVTVIMLVKTRQTRDRLEHRVTARTAELRETRAALARAARLAEMGQLTGTVAHELRNPLGVIATSITVIETRSREANLDLDAALARANRGIRRCENIITEHLDFARAKGHKPLSLILDYWLSGILDEMTIPGSFILDSDLQTRGAVIPFDPETLRRAVINLVDNACQAMIGEPENKKTSRLSVATRMDCGEAEIIVADNGPGIPANVLARVTEPLFSTKIFGTGFGLPTVQRIMDVHGGSLQIDSPSGQGTRITLRLPLTGQG